MKELLGEKINPTHAVCSLSSPEDELRSIVTLASQMCWGYGTHWFLVWDPAKAATSEVGREGAVPRGNLVWSVWRRKDLAVSNLAEPKPSSSLHFFWGTSYSQAPTPPISETASAFPGQGRPSPPDGLQYWTVLDIPDHCHCGWFGPRSRGKPGKPSLEPMVFTVSWPPLPPVPCHTKLVAVLAASLPSFPFSQHSTALLRSYLTPLKLLLPMASSLEPNPGATSQFFPFRWAIYLAIRILLINIKSRGSSGGIHESSDCLPAVSKIVPQDVVQMCIFLGNSLDSSSDLPKC